MPEATPSISDLLNAYTGAIRGQSDELADVRRGAIYEMIGGTAAIVWSREVQRDEDQFRAVSFNTAVGDDLTDMGFRRYGISRILETAGVGIANITRATTSAGAGTIYAGSRIQVFSALTDPQYYKVTQDVPVLSTQKNVTVPVQAVETGSGTSVTIVQPDRAALADPLWDSTFKVASLIVADGTDLEPADVYRARVRSTRMASRRGFSTAIIDACESVGAVHVALFESNTTILNTDPYEDLGLNVCYVGDSGYTGSTKLVNDCKLAIEKARCLGDNMQVLPMSASRLTIDAAVTLSVAPSTLDQIALKGLIADSMAQYIGRDGAFGYRLNAMAASVYRTVAVTQSVAFNAPSSDASLLVTEGGIANFPDVLTRYFLSTSDISVALNGG